MLPFPIISNTKIKLYINKAQTGSNHYSLLTSTGNLYSIGTNTNYQMGDSSLGAVYNNWQLIANNVQNFWCFSSGTLYTQNSILYFSGLPSGSSTIFGSTAVLNKEIILPPGYSANDISDMEYNSIRSWYGIIMNDGTYWYLYDTSTVWVNSGITFPASKFYHISTELVTYFDSQNSTFGTHNIRLKSSPTTFSTIGNVRFFMYVQNQSNMTGNNWLSSNSANSIKNQIQLYSTSGSQYAVVNNVTSIKRFNPMPMNSQNTSTKSIIYSIDGLNYQGIGGNAGNLFTLSSPVNTFHTNGTNRIMLLEDSTVKMYNLNSTSLISLNLDGLI